MVKIENIQLVIKGEIDLEDNLKLIISPLKGMETNSWGHGTYFQLIAKEHKYSKNVPIFEFKIKGLETGCGASMIYNISIFNLYKEYSNICKELLETILKRYRHNGIGSIITCFGQSHYKNESYKLLIDLGFKELVEYHNYIHGDSYKQKLLQLSL